MSQNSNFSCAYSEFNKHIRRMNTNNMDANSIQDSAHQ